MSAMLPARKRILGMLGATMLSSACDGTAPAPVEYVFPQDIGVVWTYATKDSVEIGDFNAGVRAPDTWTFRSLRDTTMSGMRWIRIDSLTQMLWNVAKGDDPYWIGQNGVAVFYTVRPWPSNAAGDSNRLFFPYPTLKGQTGLDSDGQPWKVLTTDTVITTAAGSFSCVRFDRPAHGETYFMSVGVGIVRKLWLSHVSVDAQGDTTSLIRGIVNLSSVQGLAQ